MSDPKPYHRFLGNGIDALLLDRSGAMGPVPAQGLDRCYWYKSDTYYADARRFAPGDDPRAFMAQPPYGTSHQLAPLGRVWFEILDRAGDVRPAGARSQTFSAESGVLTTHVRYGMVDIILRTALAATEPVLVFDLEASDDIDLVACAAPGLWPEDAEQSEPTLGREPLDGPHPGWRFAAGPHACTLRLVPLRGEADAEAVARGARLRFHGRRLRWCAVLTCSRYPDEEGAWLRVPPDPFASRVVATGRIEVPDPDFQRLHDFSMYLFPAMQHRHSGGLPVNNLRRTFNSHVFWDGAFVQRALLEAGQVGPAREAWRFLARTRDAAAANARETFAAPGLHWDWETTHSGERAYSPWMQQRFQVHNTPLLAHMVLADYRATRERAVLEEGFPLLAGAAEFLLHAVLVPDGDRLITRPLVGSHESAKPVVNDGATVAASLRLLRDVALASRLLGRDPDVGRRCAVAAHRLRPTLAALFNGRIFQASRDDDRLNTSSLAPIYPADTIPPTDPRAVATAAAYEALYAGRMAGHGNDPQGFPWSAGLLARILAYQERGDTAWEQIDLARPALCAEGGCAEYVAADGSWNSQYFSTAQAALCSALHALLLQAHGAELRLFPALPSHWDCCGFRGLLANGWRVDATYAHGLVKASVENATGRSRRAYLRSGTQRLRLDLAAGETATLELGAAR